MNMNFIIGILLIISAIALIYTLLIPEKEIRGEFLAFVLLFSSADILQGIYDISLFFGGKNTGPWAFLNNAYPVNNLLFVIATGFLIYIIRNFNFSKKI